MARRGSARHTPQSFNDQEAVSSLCAWIARTQRAMPDIKANDKWPNIDGYIEMTDDRGHPLGTLKAQVKKLTKADAKSKRFRFTKNDSREKFLRYCDESRELPIILIGVDINDDTCQLAYWRHIDKRYLESLGAYTDITFSPAHVTSRTDRAFISEWQRLVEAQNAKARIAEAFTAEELDRITRTGTRILGVVDDKFRTIHLFLDRLNDLLDHKFSIIKEIFYLNCWKVGFAYFDYRADYVGYILYPIPLNHNDVLIKEVDRDLFEVFQQRRLGYSTHHSNPIATDPAGEVERVIRRKLDIMIEEKLFNHRGSEALAREYVCAFIDRYHRLLGMEPGRDQYPLQEINEGFHVYLPFWLDEAFNFMKTNNRNNFNERINAGRIPYYNIDWGQEIGDALDTIRARVLERLRNKDDVPALPVGDGILSPRIFAELLNYLEENGFQQLRRLYSPRGRQADAFWQTLTPDRVETNLKIFLKGFLDGYDAFIENNFPAFKEKLSFLGAADTLLCVYDLQARHRGPGYTMYFLKSSSGPSYRTIEVLSRQQLGLDDSWRNVVSIAGQEYKNMGAHWESLPRINIGAPIVDLIYKVLKGRLAYVLRSE